MSRASNAAMDALHKALAETFKDLLENGEVVTDKETGEALRVKPGASTLNAIRQFLKDNDVSVAAGTSPELNALAANPKLPFPSDNDEHGLPN